MNKEILKQGFSYWFFDGDVKFEDLAEHDRYFVNEYAKWIMKEAWKMVFGYGFLFLLLGFFIAWVIK